MSRWAEIAGQCGGRLNGRMDRPRRVTLADRIDLPQLDLVRFIVSSTITQEPLVTGIIRYMTMVLALSVGWLSVVHTAAQAQVMPASIEASITKAIGAEAKTMKVTSSGSILLVTRFNSNMNGSTHEGRNNEAKVIAPLVAKEIGSNPKFGNVSTIRVEYVARSSPVAKSRIVDSVEFRKGLDGVFDFHQT